MDTTNFLEFVRSIVNRDLDAVTVQLQQTGSLATTALPKGSDTFFPEISHYVYGGDTALHMAAAAFSRPIAELLVSRGADCRAKNRRGAEPLHYACDGNRSDLQGQVDVIQFLISIGADPTAVDKSGVAPIHRAVRKRSPAAVRALLDAGASLRQPNKSGSTPLHLAVQNTGASGSGSEEAHRHQEQIIRLLLERGARPTDQDGQGKSVEQAATSEWVRALLAEAKKLPGD